MDADRLNKLREERIAREKARIAKLRELNLKKYSKTEDQTKNFNLSTTKPIKSESNIKPIVNHVKNNFHVNGTTKKPITLPTNNKIVNGATKSLVNLPKTNGNVVNTQKVANTNTKVANDVQKSLEIPKNQNDDKRKLTKVTEPITNKNPLKTNGGTTKPVPKVVLNKSANLRKSMAVTDKQNPARKTMVGRPSTVPMNNKTSELQNQSSTNVFERLYKPKTVFKPPQNEIEKLHTDPNYLKKVIRSSGLIINKRHTVFDNKPKFAMPVRRSISAVHFKRISKHELGNCIHKWSSIGDKLNNIHLQHINEDDGVSEDKVVSAVKSERKRVKFLTPMSNLNTPKPEELQSRLKMWLQKRGKSIDAYQHLQCFGIHHLPQKLNFDIKSYDDENKENIAMDSDSDDGSYSENMNVPVDKWRTASIVSDTVDFNETQNTTLTCSDVVNTDDVLIGALNDLTELLKEGFDWEQCARWLRAIRDRFPSAPHTAAYWECRASLEERRGDLPASVQCWEEAIAKGTEHSIVEANLDQLLDKFMQLKISPTSGRRRQADPKLVDVKNVFKSTIIRFAVQQAKLRQSNQMEAPKYLVTPVRRSGRLSVHCSAKRTRTPLQVCETIRQADEITAGNTLFVPNRNLNGTP